MGKKKIDSISIDVLDFYTKKNEKKNEITFTTQKEKKKGKQPKKYVAIVEKKALRAWDSNIKDARNEKKKRKDDEGKIVPIFEERNKMQVKDWCYEHKYNAQLLIALKKKDGAEVMSMFRHDFEEIMKKHGMDVYIASEIYDELLELNHDEKHDAEMKSLEEMDVKEMKIWFMQ